MRLIQSIPLLAISICSWWSLNLAPEASAQLSSFAPPAAESSQPDASAKKVTAEIVSSAAHIAPGGTVEFALRLEHAPHWHTYWKSVGDTGLPTKLKLDLPDGWSQGEFTWPTPKVFRQGDIVNYVYEGEVFLPFSITAPADAPAGSTVKITGKADWLECDDESCVPGSASLAFELPVEQTPPASTPAAGRIAEFREGSMPLEAGDDWQATFASPNANTRVLLLTPTSEAASAHAVTLPLDALYFFTADSQISAGAPQGVTRLDDGTLRFELRKSEFFTKEADTLPGLAKSPNGWLPGAAPKKLGLEFVAQPASASQLAAVSSGASGPAPQSLATFLLFGFVGGLILNLMPCVFPVIGLKIMGFVNQAGQDRKKVVAHGLVYTLGILISFWALAAVLLVLRSGGQELGWGFQLQYPGFVFALALLLLVFGLNMSGVFEIGMSAVGVGSQLTGKQGFSGSFFSGVLATVVATPCAAPFLAPALGAALALPAISSFTVFTVIGLGLAFPYLLLSLFPGAIKALPRPGAWMETFKQLMAFPLYGAVAFLIWTFDGLVDEARFLYALLGLVVAALACYIYGRYVTPSRPSQTRATGLVLSLIFLGGAVFLGTYQPKKLEWEPWSVARVAELQRENRLVYIDFTARWCATCQVNKQNVFSSETLQARFKELDVALLKADWTAKDEAITRELAAFGRSAVPFNLVYGPGLDGPIELPNLLTPQIVLEAVEKARGN